MFGITVTHIQPILKLIELFPPPAPADTTKLGAWGIIFLCCGAMAAGNRCWAEKLMNSSCDDIGPSALIRSLEEKRPDEDFAVKFSEHITDWCNNSFAMDLAKGRMEQNRGKMNPRALQCYTIYLQLAICLNSFEAMRLEELIGWDDKDNPPDFGLPELFFAAGLLVHNEASVKWHKMVTAIVGMSGPFREDVVATFEEYAGKRLFEKSESTRMMTNQLKRGMRIKLRNGWEAIVEKECEENLVTAKVFGLFTETGSIYAHDIVAVEIKGNWEPVEMTDEQRQFCGELRQFYSESP